MASSRCHVRKDLGPGLGWLGQSSGEGNLWWPCQDSWWIAVPVAVEILETNVTCRYSRHLLNALKSRLGTLGREMMESIKNESFWRRGVG